MNVNSDETYVDSLAESAYECIQYDAWDDCFDLLGIALRIEPNNVTALYVRHLIDAHFGNFNEANQCLDKILLKLPNSYEIHIAKGKILVRLEQYQDAVTHFIKAFKIKKDEIQETFGDNNLETHNNHNDKTIQIT